MSETGVVREARRPLGWRAPGPRPPRPPADLVPRSGEDLCYLTGDFRIFQRVGGHRWSLDDLATAHFAASQLSQDGAPPTRFLDLGCGIGSVLMMLAWRFPEAEGWGVEAQAGSVELARRSLRWNGLGDRCEVREGDLRTAAADLGVFDLVTGTPPYLPPHTARSSDDPQRRACRIETRGGVEDYCRAAAPRLATGGRFVLCMPGPPDGRVGQGAERSGLRVACHRPVVPREGKAPLFGLWTLRRAADVLATERPPPLVVRDRRGEWTPEFLELRREMGMPTERAESDG